MAGELLDTNVLVYSLFPTAPQHADSRALAETGKDSNTKLFVFPQILAKFFAVVTNPMRVSPAKTPEEAL